MDPGGSPEDRAELRLEEQVRFGETEEIGGQDRRSGPIDSRETCLLHLSLSFQLHFLPSWLWD